MEELISRGQALIAISVTSTILAIGTCGVRFMARRQTRRGMWWDDYSVIVAMVMGFVAMIFTSIEATSVYTPTRAMQFNYLARPWLMLGTTLAKISVCFFFLRTLGRRRPWNLFLGALILLLALANLAFALASNLMCRPLEKLWEPDVDGECFTPEAELGIAYFQGAFAVFVFLFLVIFPVLIVKNLALLKNIRWPFYVLSVSMLLSAIFCIMRTYEVSESGARASFSGSVLLATIYDVLIQNLAITAANVLPLGTLLSSPDMRSISNLIPTSHSDLESASIPSSPVLSSKASSIFYIEGNRTAEPTARPPTVHLRPVDTPVPSRPGTALSRHTTERPFTASSLLRPDTAGGISRSGIEISAGGPLPDGVDAELLRGGIIRTISVDVVEESVDDVVGRDVALGNWREILLEGPR